MYRGRSRCCWPNRGYVSILMIFFTLVYKVDLLNGCDIFSKWTLMFPVNGFRPLSPSLLFPTGIPEAGVQCLSLLRLRHSAALICWIFAVGAAQICFSLTRIGLEPGINLHFCLWKATKHFSLKIYTCFYGNILCNRLFFLLSSCKYCYVNIFYCILHMLAAVSLSDQYFTCNEWFLNICALERAFKFIKTRYWAVCDWVQLNRVCT